MKKKYEKPDIEFSEFVVAARLEGSGFIGGPHSAGVGSTCTQTASQGEKKCAPPSLPSSEISNYNC